MLQLSFRTTIIEWRGPAPFVYAPVPRPQAAEIERVKRQASYGWGVIPVEAEIGGMRFTTSLFPKDGLSAAAEGRRPERNRHHRRRYRRYRDDDRRRLAHRAAQLMPRRRIVAISGTWNSEETWPSEE